MDERPDPPAPDDLAAAGGEGRPDATPPDEPPAGSPSPSEPVSSEVPSPDPTQAADEPRAAEPPPTTEVPPTAYPPPQPPPGAEAGPAAGPPSGTATDSRWRLRRSVGDRKLKGVAGGLAAAADIDPTLVRILFAIAALSGWGLIAYLVLAIVLQDELPEDRARPLPRDQRRNLRIVLGVAAVLAAGRLFDGWFLTGRGMGLPFVLIAAGAAILWARRQQGPTLSPGGGGGATSFAGAAEPADRTWSPPPWPAGAPVPPRHSGVDESSTGRDLLRLAGAFAAVLAFLALLGGGFLVAVGAVPMRVPFLPGAIAVLGLVGLVAGVVGKARLAALFISGGVLVAAAVLAVGLSSFPGGAGDRIIAVGPDTPLQERYEQGGGRLVLDLGELDIEPPGERRVVAKVGAGQLTVIVPATFPTRITAHVGAGNAVLFGREQNGAGVTLVDSQPGEEGEGRLVLDLHVGVGQISVERPTAPTFDVTCQVPAEVKGDGTDGVTCPHPAQLVGEQMACSVALLDPGRRASGKAFCRPGGSFVPAVGQFAADCVVPKDSDVASCSPLSPGRQAELARVQASTAPSGPPPVSTIPGPTGPPAAQSPIAPGSLTCGPPDPAGVRTCTTSATTSTVAASTTAAPAQYRCTEDPVTRQLSCVPG